MDEPYCFDEDIAHKSLPMFYKLDYILFNLNTSLEGYDPHQLKNKEYQITILQEAIMEAALKLLTPIRFYNRRHYIFYLGDLQLITNKSYIGFWNNCAEKFGFHELVGEAYNLPNYPNNPNVTYPDASRYRNI